MKKIICIVIISAFILTTNNTVNAQIDTKFNSKKVKAPVVQKQVEQPATPVIIDVVNSSNNINMPINTLNTDSLELKKLIDDYNEAQKISDNAFEKLIAKQKMMIDKLPNGKGKEMAMVRMQSLVSQRGTMLQMITTIMKSLNDTKDEVIKNIGK